MGREEEVELRSLKYTLLFLISLSLIFCGSDEVDESLKVKNKVKQVSISEISNPKGSENILKITGVKFGSFIDVENDIEAIPVLSDEKVSKQYNYRWYVNDMEIDGADTSILSSDYFIEGDWIFCRASINEEGKVNPEFKSKMVKVKGPLPRLNLSEIEPQNFPGTFRYKINAYMPKTEIEEQEYTEEEETDTTRLVKFGLISPLEKGIELNTLTGEIVWNITNQIIEALGDKITIKFSIISPSGRKVNSSISLILKDSGTETIESENGPSLGNEIE